MYKEAKAAYTNQDLDDADVALRQLISGILRRCGKKRPEVAKRMGVSLARLNSWCSTAVEIREKDYGQSKVEARRPRFPAALIPLFCEAAGSDELRLFFLSDRQRHLLKLGEDAERHAEKLERQRHLLELGEQAERLVLTASRKRKKE